MIKITPAVVIHDQEISETFIAASGPGGQNVNKVATAVQLRFDVKNAAGLPEDVKRRLRQQILLKTRSSTNTWPDVLTLKGIFPGKLNW